jgi:ribosomal protein L11 methyltransferase
LAEPRRWPALVIRSNRTSAPLELEELLAALLDDFSPVAIEDLRELPLPPGGLWDPTFPPPPDPPPAPLQWRVFFSSDTDRASAAAAIHAAHPDVTVEPEDVPDGDWAARSQRAITAITAGEFVVAPPWDVPRQVIAGRKVVVIDPSRGFGTGHHASTRLCLRALSDIEVRGARVADLGTGSGVLAMAAMLKGAHQVLALDIDPEAIDSARASAKLNPRVADIAWLVADFRDRGWEALTGGPFDVVLANLTAGMLMSSAARIVGLIKKGGVLIASGFDETERAGVEQSLGLSAGASYTEDGWVGLVFGS